MGKIRTLTLPLLFQRLPEDRNIDVRFLKNIEDAKRINLRKKRNNFLSWENIQIHLRMKKLCH